MKKNFLTFIILFFFMLMLSFPSVTKNAALEGLNLWLYTVLPALLPFTIVSSLIFYLGSSLLPICGYLCGCPIGAKIAADLYKKGLISKKRATLLMCASNNLSPSFLINYAFIIAYTPFVALSSIDKWILFTFIIISSLLGAIISEQICKKIGHKKIQSPKRPSTTSNIDIKKPSFPKLFEDCILSSFEIQAKIGGYIIIFTILINLLLHTLNLAELQAATLCSLIEITSGLGQFSTCNIDSALPFHLAPAVITGLISFGGICTIMQTQTVILGSSLSIGKYITAKIISGILAFILALIYLNL